MFEPAPLVAIDEAPVPKGGEAEWFQGAGGVRLRAALFTPEGRVRGSVVLSGGRTEAIEKYYEVIGELLERGFVVLAHDWRGQGLSARELPDRLKGHARGQQSYVEDFEALLRAFEGRLPKPWIALAHSMGATIVLLAMAQGEKRFAGAMFTAPMFGVNTGKAANWKARLTARMQILFGRATRYVPGQARDPFAQEFEGNALTHDPVRFARNQALIAAEPQLALGAPTWGWLDFALGAAAYLARPDRLSGITIPVMILQAEDERLVDNPAQDAVARHLPQGQLIRAPGTLHEILMETDPMRNIFLRVFDTLTGRTAPKPAAAPKPADAPKAAEAAAPAPTPAPVTAAAPAPVAAAPAAKPAAKKPAAKKAVPKAVAAKPAAPPKAAKPVAAAKTPAPAKAVTAKAPAAKPAVKAATPKAKAPAAKPAAAKSATKAAPKPAAKAPTKKAASAKALPPKAAPAKVATSAPTKAAAAAKSAAPKTSAPKAAAKKPAAKKAPPAKA